MKRWIIRIASVLLVLAVVGYFAAKSYFTKDYIVAKIEKSINSRVQVEDLTLSFYGIGGSVTLDQVIIAQRDAAANAKTPHDEREKITSGDITIENAKFDVSIWDIFSKQILVEEINIDGVAIACTLDENGDSSIESLFAKPDKDKRNKKKKTKKFNANDNKKFVTKINEIHITNLDVNLLVEKTQLEVNGRGINLHLLNINVNPKKLEEINDAIVTIDGTFDVNSLDTGTDYARVITSGEADVTLFNAENGDLEPDMVLALTVTSDSYISSQIPVMKGVWKAADVVKNLGVEMFKLPNKIQFKNDQSVRAAYKLAKFTLLEPLSIKIKDWESEVLAQSWLETGNDQHDVEVKLHLGRTLSGALDRVIGGNSRIGGLLENLTGGQSILEDGRLALHLESSGELSDPKIRLQNDFAKPANDLLDQLKNNDEGSLRKGVEDQLKNKGMDLLRGFLE